jgi:hypothetical protein
MVISGPTVKLVANSNDDGGGGRGGLFLLGASNQLYVITKNYFKTSTLVVHRKKKG